jgi:hypothetical protein
MACLKTVLVVSDSFQLLKLEVNFFQSDVLESLPKESRRPVGL